MKKRFSKFTLVVGFALALAFTVSCSSDDDGGGGGSGGGKGNDISKYRTVLIGAQRWMAENLDYAVDGSKCYENSQANCDKYGRLYDWSTAKTVCPSGWHLPTRDDWDALATYVENANSCSNCAAKHLKATSGWNTYEGKSGNGTGNHDFSALPGGYGIPDGRFGSAGNSGRWWSASEDDSYGAYYRGMFYTHEHARWYSYDKSFLFSVRCVQDGNVAAQRGVTPTL